MKASSELISPCLIYQLTEVSLSGIRRAFVEHISIVGHERAPSRILLGEQSAKMLKDIVAGEFIYIHEGYNVPLSPSTEPSAETKWRTYRLRISGIYGQSENEVVFI